MMGKTAYEKILKYKYYVLTGINKEEVDFPAKAGREP